MGTSNWWRVPSDSPTGLRNAIEKDLPDQIAESGCDTVVFSDEGLSRMPLPGLAILVEALGPIDELVIVVYLRRQDEHLVSRSKQSIQSGETHVLSDLLARPRRSAPRSTTGLADLATRSRRRGLRCAPTIPPVPGAKPRGRLPGGHRSPGLDYDTDSSVNASLDACTTSTSVAECHPWARPEVDRRLTKLADSPDLRLEEEEHHALWEQLRPSNTRLVEEFLPDAEDIFLAAPQSKDAITQREITDEDLARLEARLVGT